MGDDCPLEVRSSRSDSGTSTRSSDSALLFSGALHASREVPTCGVRTKAWDGGCSWG
jgi:hypothetical protein